MGGFDSEELAEWSGGEWLDSQPSGLIKGFAYDTRQLKKGDLFVAFKTDRRNGHDFLADAKAKGAAAALVQECRECPGLPLLRVEDTLQAFHSIAHRFRDTWSFPVIGITGSCGKTTTKDLLYQLLGGAPSVQATRGNLNNLIGVPTTLLEVSPTNCRWAIIEAGISEPGEMGRLAETIDPDWVVFTAIGPAHLERLGSVEGVAKEKGLLAGGPRAHRVYLGESCRPYQKALKADAGIAVSEESVGASGWRYRVEAAERGMRLCFDARKEAYRIDGKGRGLASNAALAIAVARDLGLSPERVQERLANWKSSGMRGEWKTVGQTRVFLDCYNANPLSMEDALETFYEQSDSNRNRLYVIGCMGELGPESAKWHQELGRRLQLGPGDRAFVIGDESNSILEGIQESETMEGRVELLASLESLRPSLAEHEGDVFVKGSRKYQLEKVMDYVPQKMCDEGVSC